MYGIDDAGNEKVLHVLGPKTVMPFSFFSGDSMPTRWYYETLTDCEVHVLSRQDLERLLFSNGDAGRFLVHRFSQEVHEILVRLDSLGKSEIPHKLRAALTYLVVCHGEQLRRLWWRIPFPANHQFLADLIGVTRENAAIAVKQLADCGVIRYPKVAQLEIHYTKLQKLASSTNESFDGKPMDWMRPASTQFGGTSRWQVDTDSGASSAAG